MPPEESERDKGYAGQILLKYVKAHIKHGWLKKTDREKVSSVQ